MFTTSPCIASTSSTRTRALRGFTLVELLVVIGIIALLISILLPSLNRARQQAYLVDCQSRMRQIGQAIQMYAVENHGWLPPSNVDQGTDPGQWIPEHVPGEYWLPSFLTRTLGSHGDVNGYVGRDNPSPIFSDNDVNVALDWGIKVGNHYGFNPAMFPTPGWNIVNLDPVTHAVLPGSPPLFIRITKIKHSAEVVAAWDVWVPSTAVFGGTAYFCSPCIQDVNAQDAYWYAGAKFLPNASYGYYESGIAVGDAKAPNIQAKIIGGLPFGEVDFRHVGGKMANFMYLDGHVESHRVGEVKISDFCFDWR